MLGKMSAEEIAEAQRKLIESLGMKPTALEKLKNLGKPSAKKVSKDTEKIAQILAEDFGAQVVGEAVRMEQTQIKVNQIGLDQTGQLKQIEEEASRSNHKYLSYIAEDGFEELDEKVFSVQEISNLLASTDHR